MLNVYKNWFYKDLVTQLHVGHHDGQQQIGYAHTITLKYTPHSTKIKLNLCQIYFINCFPTYKQYETLLTRITSGVMQHTDNTFASGANMLQITMTPKIG